MDGVEQLDAGLDRLAAVDVTALPPAVLAGSLVELDRAQARLAAEKARRLAAFDAAGGYRAAGAVSAAGWLRQACRTGDRDARTQVRVAAELRGLPAVGGALAAGEFGWAHAEAMSGVLADVHARLAPGRAAAVEAALLGCARGESVDVLRLAVRRLRERLDPDGELGRAEREFDRRWLSAAVTGDGLVYLRGMLDREGGAIVLAALDAATAPPVECDARSRGQARADALVEGARRLLDAGVLPATAGQRPHLTVTVDLPTLRRAAADLLAAGGLDPATPADSGQQTRPVPSPAQVAETTRILGAAAALVRGPAGPGGVPPAGAADPADDPDPAEGASPAGGADPDPAAGGTAPASGADPPEESGRGPDLAGILTGRTGAGLDWTGPIPAATALRVACDATVTRLLLGPDGQPLHLGRTRRLVSRGQWIALVARDGGCIAPGCGRPPQWCEAHHVVPWVLGGRTDIDKLALLCRIHHRHSHEGGWIVARDEHGRYTLRPPGRGTRRDAHRGRDPATGHVA